MADSAMADSAMAMVTMASGLLMLRPNPTTVFTAMESLPMLWFPKLSPRPQDSSSPPPLELGPLTSLLSRRRPTLRSLRAASPSMSLSSLVSLMFWASVRLSPTMDSAMAMEAMATADIFMARGLLRPSPTMASAMESTATEDCALTVDK